MTARSNGMAVVAAVLLLWGAAEAAGCGYQVGGGVGPGGSGSGWGRGLGGGWGH